ncbi:IGF2R family protein [Megaselia abdita]
MSGGRNPLVAVAIAVLSVFQSCDFAYAGKGDVNTNVAIFDNKSCLVKDPTTNFTVDLNTLNFDEKPFFIPQTIVLGFNFCHKLEGGCGSDKNVLACLRRDDNNHTLGFNGEYDFKIDNGNFSFEFPKGGNCSEDKLFSLRALIGCGTENKTKLSFVREKSDNCSYTVLLETPKACFPSAPTTTTTQPPSNSTKPPPPPSTPSTKKVEYSNCLATDSANINYNLNQLQYKTHKNVITGDWNFTVRICSHDEVQIPKCPPGTSICLNNGTNFQSFGNSANLTYDKNLELTMKFKSDVKCKDNMNYTSTIIFNCSKGEGKPEVTKLGCDFRFEWKTIYACNSEPCEAVHPETGFRFDMNPLKTKFNSTAEQGKVYNFAICKSSGAPCSENDGSCVEDKGRRTSLGKFNDKLHFNKTGSPYLLYENGDKCNSSNVSTNWTTKIEFVCAKDSHITIEPKVIETSNCQLLIQYPTPLACQNQIKCTSDGYGSNDEGIDLSLLMSTTKNYEVNGNDGKKFFLNVCRPLVLTYGLSCPGGSAACMTTAPKEKSLPENETSLGYPDIELTATGSNRAELRYVNGSECPHDKSQRLSAIIEFRCDVRAGRGNVSMDESYNETCKYRFIWSTNVICPSQPCAFKAGSCEVYNKVLNVSYNLKSFGIVDGNGQIKSNGVVHDICDGQEGKSVSVTADYVKKFVKINLNYDNNSNKTNTELQLYCDDNDHSTGDTTKHEQGYYVYKHQTPTICSFLGMTSKAEHIQPSDQSSVGATFAWILGTAFIAASVFFALRTSERREKFADICRRGYDSLRYSRVTTQSNENSNLLLNFRPSPLEESDDDPIL